MIRLAWILPVLLYGGTAQAADAKQVVRRFALVIGANDGGAERVRLRYAESDAKALVNVLTELGGVAGPDAEVLLEPSVEQLHDAIRRIGERAARVRTGRTELLLYYSGHSDEEGLLLGGRRLGYRELRRALEEVDVDVRIGILDSCASGALTRTKGGRRLPPFLVDESTQVSGHAFLTSASATEAAQESDRLGGSFFTHYLISGLRGAADSTGDGRVTLNEAYHFAFGETLARTEKTLQGPQHPSYDIQLAGTGDLVMTDLRVTQSGLTLERELHGRVYVHDAEQRLVAELYKVPGRTVDLGLEPGDYRIVVYRDDEMFEANVTVGTRYRSRVAVDDLDTMEQEVARARGGAPTDAQKELEEILRDGASAVDRYLQRQAARLVGLAEKEQPDTTAQLEPRVVKEALPPYRTVPFHLTVIPGLHGDENVEARFAFGPLVSSVDRLQGASLSLGANVITESARGSLVAIGANLVGGDMRGVTLSSGVNIVGGQMRGGQASPGVNIAGGGLRGAQVTSGVNIARGEVVGGQVSGGFNIAGPITGPQVAGGFNIAYGNARVAQVAGGFNWGAGTMLGLQLAGGFNWAADGVRGMQIAGGINRVGGDSKGGQVAPVNIAGNLRGAQIGVVNVGREIRGLQLGVVNIAEEVHGLSFAPLNFIKNGRRHIDYWITPNERVNLSLRFGSQHTYTLLAVGFQSPKNKDRWYAALGFGGRIPFDPAFFAFDASVGNWYEGFDFDKDGGPKNIRAQIRVFAGLELFGEVGLFAGVSENAAIGFDGEDIRLQGVPQVVDRKRRAVYRYYPSYFVGVQI